MFYFEVELISRTTGDRQKILVNTPCHHGMQEFVDELEGLEIDSPKVERIRLAKNVKLRPIPALAVA